MKNQLKEYILTNPNTWARYINKRPELLELISSQDGNTIAEKAYIAVYGVTRHQCCCGKATMFENFMKGYRPYCSTLCNQHDKKSKADEQLIERIQSLVNFELLSDLEKGGKYGRKIFTVRNKNCNHVFQVNNLDLFTNPDDYCAVCGPTKRQQKMTNKNKERHLQIRTEVMLKQDLTFIQYSRLVRTLTRKVYEKYKSLINPNNLKITRSAYHLDHIVSIYDCWKNAVDPKLVSAASNLQVLLASDNLSKSHKSNDLKLASIIKESNWSKCLMNIDEIQISSSVISCENFKIGVALPCSTTSDAINQHPLSKHFPRYSFYGEYLDIKNSRLRYWLNDSNEKIDARKCEVVDLKAYECRKFLDRNHSQGFLTAKIYLGLKYDGRLVSVMTFGKPRFDKKHEWELFRFASSTNVRGAASKLFKHFIKKIDPNSIISYSNKSYGTGQVYSILGFSHTHCSPPTQFYYSENDPLNIIKTSSFRFSNKEEMDGIRNKYIPFLNKGNDVFVWKNDK